MSDPIIRKSADVRSDDKKFGRCPIIGSESDRPISNNSDRIAIRNRVGSDFLKDRIRIGKNRKMHVRLIHSYVSKVNLKLCKINLMGYGIITSSATDDVITQLYNFGRVNACRF